MLAKALWHTDINTTEWRNQPLSDDTLQTYIDIKTNYSMISTGTERLVASGAVPRSMYEQMSVPYMEGNFDFPIKYGYACGGHSDNGTFYHYMHPHQDICRVHPDALFRIENDLSAFKIPLISNMETALNAIWDAECQPKQTIAICGFGNVGALLANTLRHYSQKETTIIEKDNWRCQKAESMGWKVGGESQANFDIIFHTTATEKGLQYCINHLNPEGKVIDLSWYGTKKIQLELGADFHYKRLTIKSSQVGKISPSMPEMDYTKRKTLAADLLRKPGFDELVTNIISWKEAPLVFNDIRKKQLPNGLIWLIQYE